MIDNLLEHCNTIRPGFIWNREKHSVTCDCGCVAGKYVSSKHVFLVGKNAQLCIYVGNRNRLAFIRQLPTRDGGALGMVEGPVGPDDLPWVIEQVDRLLPIFDALEHT